jgi:hypothetical protein
MDGKMGILGYLNQHEYCFDLNEIVVRATKVGNGLFAKGFIGLMERHVPRFIQGVGSILSNPMPDHPVILESTLL